MQQRAWVGFKQRLPRKGPALYDMHFRPVSHQDTLVTSCIRFSPWIDKFRHIPALKDKQTAQRMSALRQHANLHRPSIQPQVGPSPSSSGIEHRGKTPVQYSCPTTTGSPISTQDNGVLWFHSLSTTPPLFLLLSFHHAPTSKI